MTVAANVNVGRITQIIGPVMDIEFPAGKMPNIYNALTITGQNGAGEPVLSLIYISEPTRPY